MNYQGLSVFAIGDFILDVTALEKSNLLTLSRGPYFGEPRWNALMAARSAVLCCAVTALFEKLRPPPPQPSNINMPGVARVAIRASTCRDFIKKTP